MAYLDYPGLAYFKSLLDQTYLCVDYDGDTTIAGNVTFTNPITGDIDGRAKKDWLGQQFDTTYLKDIQPDESGALKLILGNGQVSHLVTDTTVTQERSSANETYPVLLCYDENATADQIAKKVKYGHDVQINPAYGYIYAQGYTEKHPTYNRTTTQSSRVEWMLDFKDSVLNPVGQIYSYIDPSNQGGEHRMELRLYGNPHTTSLNLPNYNFETDTVSLGISSTKGDKLTFFGYAPSTPIYLENGSTMRKSTVRGDQYGRDIITRDWLNLNGSITGLVHTYMDETIDGLKTFLKTVTIDSGDANNKAGLYVQGDANLHSNVHVYGNEDIDGNLNVDGTSDQHGNVHMYHNLDVDGNANTDGNQTVGGTLTVTGKITGNGGAEVSGGNGLKVNGTTTTTNLSVTDDATVGDDLTVNGDAAVAGTINKKSGNTTTEYVQYITNQDSSRKLIAQNLVDTSRGVGYDASTGKIYAKIDTTQGLKFSNSGEMQVDFSNMPTDKFEALLKQLKMLIPLSSHLDLYVATDGVNDRSEGRGLSVNKPFATIQYAAEFASSTYSLGNYSVRINVADGNYGTTPVNLPGYTASSGNIYIKSISQDPTKVKTGYFFLDSAVNYTIHDITATHADGTNGVMGCFAAHDGGKLTLVNVVADLSDVNQNAMYLCGFYVKSGGYIKIWATNDNNHPSGVGFKANSNSVIGGCFYAEDSGLIEFAADVRVQGSFNMTGAFARSVRFGTINSASSVYTNPGRSPRITTTGTVTGIRYRGDSLSVIGGRGNTAEEGEAYYPGDTAGSVTHGSQYTYANVTN